MTEPSAQSAQAPTNEILIHARRQYRADHGAWPSRGWTPLAHHIAAATAAIASGQRAGDTTTAPPPPAAPQRPQRTQREAKGPTAPPPPNPFDAAYANPHNEIGPIVSRWNDRGIAEWLLPIGRSN